MMMGFLMGCSNLDHSRFSKDFYEEKRLQLTRKSELIVKDKVKLVAFATYMSELDFETYPKGEVFLVEIAFNDETITMKDISFSLLDRKPLKIQKVSPKMQKKQKLFKHSPWNQMYLITFKPILPIETTKILLEMKVKGQSADLFFDYSYIVENVL